MTFFVTNLEHAFESWVTLLARTTLQSNKTSTDPNIITAFQLLDSTINRSDTIRSRLTSIQLLRVFKSLKDVITSKRRNKGERGRRNASVAISIH